MAKDKVRHVFVVGCPRSGTTLAARLLAASDRVFNAEESFLVYLLDNWHAMLRPPVAPLSPLFLQQAGDLVRNITHAETAKRKKTHYLDHTPWHGLCMERIWELFPEANIVFAVRHPESVIDSLRLAFEGGFSWAGGNRADRVALWRKFAHCALLHSDDPRVYLLRYEDMWASPESTARLLFAQADLPWEPKALWEYAVRHAPSSEGSPTIAKEVSGTLRFQSHGAGNEAAETEWDSREVLDEMQEFGYL